MKTERALIRLEGMAVALDAGAPQIRESLLAESEFIVGVDSPEENEVAQRAFAKIKRLLAEVEGTRKDIKDPVLQLGRDIDATAKMFCDDLVREATRLGGLMGGYLQRVADRQRREQEERRRIEAERIAAERAELARIEDERKAAIAAAKTPDAVNLANQVATEKVVDIHFDRPVAAPVPARREPLRPVGQTARPDWNIIVLDYMTLATAFPQCVVMTPAVAEIKRLLAAGIEVPGIKAEPITRVGVR